MTYPTLKACRMAQPFGSIRKRLHYNKLPNGRWCATLDGPADPRAILWRPGK